MALEEGMSQNEIELQKTLFTMSKMVKVLYEDYLDEATQIKLASLRLSGTTLIWWQSKWQHGTQQVGNVFPSWQDFVFALRKQFYPLGHKEKALIE
jgi:hypothetical protein